jgi:hypothetical protein
MHSVPLTSMQDVGSAACPHTGIRVQGLCQQPLPGCPDELVSLRPHPQHPTLAVSLDKVNTRVSVDYLVIYI